MSATRPTLLLSVDYEDWHQLVRRRVGASNWREAGPALARQTDALLALLDELRRARDVLRARDGGSGAPGPARARSSPPGTRSPATAMPICPCTRRRRRSSPPTSAPPGPRSSSSQVARRSATARRRSRSPRPRRSGPTGCWRRRDSPTTRASTTRRRSATTLCRVRDHRRTAIDASLWEFPVAVWRAGRTRIPVGGASYWQVLPTPADPQGLTEAGPLAGLYLHPNELDPRAAARAAPGRRDRSAARSGQAARGPAQRRPPARPVACSGRSRAASS